MRMFPHFKGLNSSVSIQLSALRAKLFRNGATRGALTLFLPTALTCFDHGRGWYVFYGSQYEVQRVMNYIQNRVESFEAEETLAIRQLLHAKLNIREVIVPTVATGLARPTKLTGFPSQERHRQKPHAPTSGALRALQRKLTRHVA